MFLRDLCAAQNDPSAYAFTFLQISELKSGG